MDTGFTAIIILFIGIVIGTTIAWLFARARLKAVETAEIATLAERLRNRDDEVGKLRESAAKDARQYESLRIEHSNLMAQLEGERRAAQERAESFKQAADELSEKFRALSRDALNENNESFLQLASEIFDSRRKSIDELVRPLKDSLDKVDGQVKSLAASELRLQSETEKLVQALRTPHVRGRWGEIQLRRVIELAGMVEHCDFIEQETFETEEKRLRPDVIVKLPSHRTIVIDAKVPFEAFYQSLSASDEETRRARLAEHAKLVRNHISALSKKSYWDMFQPAPEFVLLFLPGETFYNAALEHDPKLIEDGVEQRVIIATPTTLIALLKAVSYGWRQERLTETAEAISQLGKELYDRVRRFALHFMNVGRGLERAIDAYNEGVGSFNTRVLVSTRKFKELGASTGEEVETIESIDKSARALQMDDSQTLPVLFETNSQEENPADKKIIAGSASAGGVG